MTSKPADPLVHSDVLDREIRLGTPGELGISTYTLIEEALDAEAWDLAARLTEYARLETWRITDGLLEWVEWIVTFRVGERHANAAARRLIGGLRRAVAEAPGQRCALRACRDEDAAAARRLVEQCRLRNVTLHDAVVLWIERLIGELAERCGEEAVRDMIALATEHVWAVRYRHWDRMAPLERLAQRAESMRGHLTGARRRGDMVIIEHPDHYEMVMDPCGSCGVLRNGDPSSGRPPTELVGNRVPHSWTWNRVGLGWYVSHGPIVAELLWGAEHNPDLPPNIDCDTRGRPCRALIAKVERDAG